MNENQANILNKFGPNEIERVREFILDRETGRNISFQTENISNSNPLSIQENLGLIYNYYKRKINTNIIFYYSLFLYDRRNSSNDFRTFNLREEEKKKNQLIIRLFLDIVREQGASINYNLLNNEENILKFQEFLLTLKNDFTEKIITAVPPNIVEETLGGYSLEEIFPDSYGNNNFVIQYVYASIVLGVSTGVYEELTERIVEEINKSESESLLPFISSVLDKIADAGGNYLKICDYGDFKFKVRNVRRFMKTFSFLLQRPRSGYVMRRINYRKTSINVETFVKRLSNKLIDIPGRSNPSKLVKFNTSKNLYIYFSTDLSTVRYIFIKDERRDTYKILYDLDSPEYSSLYDVGQSKIQPKINISYFIKNHNEIFQALQTTMFGVRRREKRKNVIASLSQRYFRPPGTELELLNCLTFDTSEGVKEIVKEIAIDELGVERARELMSVNIPKTTSDVIAEINTIPKYDPEKIKVVREQSEENPFLPNPDDLVDLGDLFENPLESFKNNKSQFGDAIKSITENEDIFDGLTDGSKWLESISDLLMVTAVTGANLGFAAAADAAGRPLDPEAFVKRRLSKIITGEALKSFLRLIPPGAYFNLAVAIGLLQTEQLQEAGLEKFIPRQDSENSEEEIEEAPTPTDSAEPAVTEGDPERVLTLFERRQERRERKGRNPLPDDNFRATLRRRFDDFAGVDEAEQARRSAEESTLSDREASAEAAREAYGGFITFNEEGTNGNVLSRRYKQNEQQDLLRNNTFSISDELIEKIKTELGLADPDLTPTEKVQLMFSLLFEEILTCEENSDGTLKNLIIDLILDFVGFDVLMEDFGQIAQFLNAWDARNIDFCDPPDLPFADFVFNFLLGNFNFKLGNPLDILKAILAALLAVLLALVLGIISAIINLILSIILESLAFLNSLEPCDIMNFVRDVSFRIQARCGTKGFNLGAAIGDETLSIFCRELLTQEIDPRVSSQIACAACSILTPNQYLNFLRGQSDRQTANIVSNYLVTRANLPPEERKNFPGCEEDNIPEEAYYTASQKIKEEPEILIDLGAAIGNLLLPRNLDNILDEINQDVSKYCGDRAASVLSEKPLNSEEYQYFANEAYEKREKDLDTLMGLMTDPNFIQNEIQKEMNKNPMFHPTRILAGYDKKIARGEDFPDYSAEGRPMVDRDSDGFGEITILKIENASSGFNRAGKNNTRTIVRNLSDDYLEDSAGLLGGVAVGPSALLAPIPGVSNFVNSINPFSAPPPKNYEILERKYKLISDNLSDSTLNTLSFPSLEFGLFNLKINKLSFSGITQTNFDLTSPAYSNFIFVRDADIEKQQPNFEQRANTKLNSYFTINYENSLNQLVQLTTNKEYNFEQTNYVFDVVKNQEEPNEQLENNSLNYEFFKESFKQSINLNTTDNTIYSSILEDTYRGLFISGIEGGFNNILKPKDPLPFISGSAELTGALGISEPVRLNYGAYLANIIPLINIDNLKLDNITNEIQEEYFTGSFNQLNTLKRFRQNDPAYIESYLFTDDADLAILDKSLELYAHASFLKSSYPLINNVVNFGAPTLLKNSGDNNNIIKEYYFNNLLNDLEDYNLRIPYLVMISDIQRMKGEKPNGDPITAEDFDRLANIAIESYYEKFLDKMFTPDSFLRRFEEQIENIDKYLTSIKASETSGFFDSIISTLEEKKAELETFVEDSTKLQKEFFKTYKETTFSLKGNYDAGAVKVIDRPSIFNGDATFNLQGDIGAFNEPKIRALSHKNIAISQATGGYVKLLERSLAKPVLSSNYAIEFHTKQNIVPVYALARFIELFDSLSSIASSDITRVKLILQQFVESVFTPEIPTNFFSLNVDDAVYLLGVLNTDSRLSAMKDFIYSIFNVKLSISNGLLLSYDELINKYSISADLQTYLTNRRSFFVITSADDSFEETTDRLRILSGFRPEFLNLEGAGCLMYVDIYSKQYDLDMNKLAGNILEIKNGDFSLNMETFGSASEVDSQNIIFNQVFKPEEFDLFYDFIMNVENLIYLKTIYYARRIIEIEDDLARKSNFRDNRVLSNPLKRFRRVIAKNIKAITDLD